MDKSVPGTRIHHFSDSSLDAIHEVTAFLRANADAEYRSGNADVILYQVITGDHDPSETLYDALKQCRIGTFAGTLIFMADELALLQEEMTNLCKVARNEKLTLRASLVETALHETNDCIDHLEQKNMPEVCRSFQRVRTTLFNLRTVCPEEAITPEIRRVLHATALAWDLLNYSSGK
jgi:hypothetical protein